MPSQLAHSVLLKANMTKPNGDSWVTRTQQAQKRRWQRTTTIRRIHHPNLLLAVALLVLLDGSMLATSPLVNAFVLTKSSAIRIRRCSSGVAVALSPEEQALERTKQQLLKLQKSSKRRTPSSSNASGNSPELEEIETQIQEYLRLPANTRQIRRCSRRRDF